MTWWILGLAGSSPRIRQIDRDRLTASYGDVSWNYDRYIEWINQWHTSTRTLLNLTLVQQICPYWSAIARSWLLDLRRNQDQHFTRISDCVRNTKIFLQGLDWVYMFLVYSKYLQLYTIHSIYSNPSMYRELSSRAPRSTQRFKFPSTEHFPIFTCVSEHRRRSQGPHESSATKYVHRPHWGWYRVYPGLWIYSSSCFRSILL